MKKMKNNLDERQEQKLLHIEKSGCWFAFWALLISIFVQQAIFGITNFEYVIGEWIVFMALAIYLLMSLYKNGIWDRRLKADPKTNLLISLAAAVVGGTAMAAVNYFNYRAIEGAIASFVVFVVIIFAFCFAALSISAAMYKKRVQQLEAESDIDTE